MKTVSSSVALSIALSILGASAAVHADAGKTQLTWYGHAAFKLVTPSGKILFVDPWISNPSNPDGAKEVAAIDKADLILITHGHSDHVGDAVAIAKKTKAQLVASFDLGNAIVHDAGFPATQFSMMTGGNAGGEIKLLDGEVSIAFIPAVHSSTVASGAGTPQEKSNYGGAAGGFLISIKNGPSIYHTGDTDLFSDMSLITKFHKVDVMLACIGGHFTMDADGAALAASYVKPEAIVPMHFDVFPVFTGTPDKLRAALKARKVKSKVVELKPGEAQLF
jgi:L-ascorbate metabolism protein UlaG (beta-lactamase superfamily)